MFNFVISWFCMGVIGVVVSLCFCYIIGSVFVVCYILFFVVGFYVGIMLLRSWFVWFVVVWIWCWSFRMWNCYEKFGLCCGGYESGRLVICFDFFLFFIFSDSIFWFFVVFVNCFIVLIENRCYMLLWVWLIF